MNADAYLIAPASANTIAKLAHGLADNLVCTAALAARCPVLVAPAMNDAMWEHPATQANVAALAARGVTILEPQVGALGSKGEWGVGRLVEPPQLLGAVEAAIGSTPTGGRGPACGCSSRPAARASRSTRCATSATARRGAWARARRRGGCARRAT